MNHKKSKKVAILTNEPSCRGPQAFRRAIEQEGMKVEFVKLDQPDVVAKLRASDYAIFRINPKYDKKYYELQEKLNSPQLANILRASNKISFFDKLSKMGIPIPPTKVIPQENPELPEGFKLPVVIKVPNGNRGYGVELAKTPSDYNQITDKYFKYEPKLICQAFIAESHGSDKRLIVAADKVVAAMRRIGKEGDFRANLSQGGRGEAYQPTPEEVDLAIRAAKAFNLDYVGVDIIDGPDSPLALELNPSPGFGISSIVGYDVATRIIKRLKQGGKI